MTSCRPIQSVIILLINKSDSRCAVVRFCYHSYDYRLNWTPLSPIAITYSIPVMYDLVKSCYVRIHERALLATTVSSRAGEVACTELWRFKNRPGQFEKITSVLFHHPTTSKIRSRKQTTVVFRSKKK